jgi:capsular exopolysaccharide synthesis family protein
MDQEKLLVMADVRQLLLFVHRNLRLMFAITVATTFIALMLAWVLPVHYQATSTLLLESRKLKLTALEDAPNVPPDSSAVRSEMDIIQSRSVVDRVIKDLNLLDDNDFVKPQSWLHKLLSHSQEDEKINALSRAAAKLVKNLDVTNDGRSFTIAIRYTDHDATKAEQIANAFADEYLVDQLEVKYDMMQRANAWLSERSESLRNEVSTAEKAVEDYKNTHNLMQVNDETVAQQQYSAVNVQISQANAELSQAEARLKGVKGMSQSDLESSATVLSSPLIQQLKQQEAEVRRKEADLSTRYGDRHPLMIDARNELASIHAKVDEEIHKVISGMQNDVFVAQAKLESLQKEQTRLKAENGVGNEAMVTLRQLEREATVSRNLYEGFLNRSKAVTEQQDLRMADARIIARADKPLKPTFPNTLLFLVMGIALGLMFGFITALLLEYMDRGFRTLDLIEKICGVSGLGSIPALDLSGSQTVAGYVLEKPLSAYAEALRSINTSIVFSNVDAKPKVIMVTSSLPEEGKSVFVGSYARILAKSGSKVLVIDADMRRPRMNDIFSLDKSKPDLAAVLAQTSDLQSALQKDKSGADVLIAKAKTPNPHDLLASKQMEHLIAQARSAYDTIIIDTPPIMAVADAAIIGKLVDTGVYVVRWAHTPREIVGEGIKLFRNYNLKLAGIVLTQVDMRTQQQYGFSGYYDDKYKGYYSN